MVCPLSEVKPGIKCRIKSIKQNRLCTRLMEVGIFNNSEIEVIRTAPLKDPLECKVGNFYIGLRKSEASLIIVEPLR